MSTSDDGRIPVGTRVRYHGSLAKWYDEPVYVVQGYSDLSKRHDLTPELLAEHWPSGIAYDLWPEGVPVKFGDRCCAMFFVRRESFTVIEEDS